MTSVKAGGASPARKKFDEFYVATRLKHERTFEFRKDILAPIVAALLHAGNEYAWGAPSCGTGSVMIVLSVLSGRCDSTFDAPVDIKVATPKDKQQAFLRDVNDIVRLLGRDSTLLQKMRE